MATTYDDLTANDKSYLARAEAERIRYEQRLCEIARDSYGTHDTTPARPRYGFIDFTEDESPTKVPEYVLSIGSLGDDGSVYGEIASMVHLDTPESPIDGPEADRKRRNAQLIVDALNAYDGPQPA